MRTSEIQFPKSICLRLTRRCNAACSFCQAPNTSPTNLTVDVIDRLCAIFEARGVRSLKLSGGEPTTRSDLPAILETIRKHNLQPVVITNGIRFDQDLVPAAATTGTEFKFSVHRPDQTNDQVLRVKSFEAIVANMMTCQRTKIPFSINTVVTGHTINTMAPIALFALNQGARKVSFIPVVPRGRAARAQRDSINQTELQIVRGQVDNLARHYLGQMIVRCIDIRNQDYWIVENDGTLWIERSSENLDIHVCDLADLLQSAPPIGSNHEDRKQYLTV